LTVDDHRLIIGSSSVPPSVPPRPFEPAPDLRLRPPARRPPPTPSLRGHGQGWHWQAGRPGNATKIPETATRGHNSQLLNHCPRPRGPTNPVKSPITRHPCPSPADGKGAGVARKWCGAVRCGGGARIRARKQRGNSTSCGQRHRRARRRGGVGWARRKRPGPMMPHRASPPARRVEGKNHGVILVAAYLVKSRKFDSLEARLLSPRREKPQANKNTSKQQREKKERES